MKVILMQDVKNLGKKGDVVEAAEGYARNFLLPKRLVVEASKANLTQLAQENAHLKAKKDKELEQAKATGEKLREAVINICAKAGEGGRLFGSVTNKEISEQVAGQFKVKVDKRKIEISEPIKNLGTYEAVIKLHPEVQVKVKINVCSQ
ncbi:MAG: 50S ribosomal protein L9 [Desulfitobacteriaceae bacterium]|nr:50S ribosomal protein L9 [Desulfitobacteriaceae bacterium]MDD4751709.1 50S ribosomal protein L9 [Desulfitobacteriaceae bacterium]